MAELPTEQVPLTRVGEITGHHGVRGWVRVRSYMRPPEGVLDFSVWWVLCAGHRQPRDYQQPSRKVFPLESRKQRSGFLVRLEGVTNREQAEPLIGCGIAIALADLPELPPGEYYWEDLVGLLVVNMAGESLGRVDHLLETGANDVLVVRQEPGDGDIVERLLPWTTQVVRSVEADEGILRVDWDAEF
jgi:16S rRNA processing protein RimM